jgi:hypothetical protein
MSFAMTTLPIRRLFRLIFLLLFVASSHYAHAQKDSTREDKMYFRSGFGFSFPVGNSNDYLSTKFSTSLGLVIALGKGPLFLYPKLDLHAYGFNQLVPEADYQNLGKNGRATTYLLNMALGYRAVSDKFGFYGFLGAGGGMILTPRVKLSENNSIATLTNKATGMPIMETGLGVDYSLGTTLLFFEAGYLRGFTKVQNRSFQSVPLNLGVKTNISKLFF